MQHRLRKQKKKKSAHSKLCSPSGRNLSSLRCFQILNYIVSSFYCFIKFIEIYFKTINCIHFKRYTMKLFDRYTNYIHSAECLQELQNHYHFYIVNHIYKLLINWFLSIIYNTSTLGILISDVWLYSQYNDFEILLMASPSKFLLFDYYTNTPYWIVVISVWCSLEDKTAMDMHM